MCVQLCLCLHFYLLYLFLNSCDINYVLLRHSLVVKLFGSFSRKHRILYLQILSAKQSD